MKDMRISLLILLFGGLTSTTTAQNFVPLDEGLNRNPARFIEDTAANVLYAAGDFTHDIANNSPLHGVAQWDGLQWSPTVFSDPACQGNNLCPTRTALALFDQKLLCAIKYGNSSDDRQYAVVSWDGSVLDTLGHFDQLVRQLKVIDGELYAMGWFDEINGQENHQVGKYENGNWVSLNFPGSTDGGYVINLVKYRGDLYVAGNFETPGFDEVAVYKDGVWADVGGSLHTDSWVHDIEVYKDELYIGGYFRVADGNTANWLQKWDGQQWSEVGGGLQSAIGNGAVLTLQVHNGYLFAGGGFTQVGDIQASHLARWDGAQWCSLGDFSNPVHALGEYNGDLLIVHLGEVNGVAYNNILAFQGEDFTSECGTPVTVDEFAQNKALLAFPNPAQNQLIVEFESQRGDVLRLFNQMGQEVLREELTGQSDRHAINIEALAPGPYSLTISSFDRSYSQVVLKL